MRTLITKTVIVVLLVVSAILLDRRLNRPSGDRAFDLSQPSQVESSNTDADAANEDENLNNAAFAEPEEIERQVRDALELIDANQRRESLAALAKRLAEEDPAKFWAWQSRIPAFADREAFSSAFLISWAGRELNRALQAAESLPPSALRSSCVACVVGEWAKVLPVAAIDYAKDQLVGAARRQALEAAVESWASKDPASALDWSLEPLHQEHGFVFEAAIETWTEMAPNDAAAWIVNVPDEAIQSRATEALVARWAEQYPQEAGEWIEEHDASMSLSNEAATVAASWAELNPEGAANWSLNLDRTVTRREAVTHAIASWAAADPQAAMNWLDAQRKGLGDAAPAAYQSLAASWSAQSPYDAANWLAELQDRQLAHDLAPAVFNTWAGSDPQSMSSWVKAHPNITIATLAHAELDRLSNNP